MACLRIGALEMTGLNKVRLYTINTAGPLLPDLIMAEVSATDACFSLREGYSL
jgi:hypothetical protein